MTSVAARTYVPNANAEYYTLAAKVAAERLGCTEGQVVGTAVHRQPGYGKFHGYRIVVDHDTVEVLCLVHDIPVKIEAASLDALRAGNARVYLRSRMPWRMWRAV